MSWFSNLRMRNKLVGAFVIVLAMMAGLGLFSMRSLSKIEVVTDKLTADVMPSIQTLGQLRAELRDGRIHWLSILVADEERVIQEHQRAAGVIRDDTLKTVREYEKWVASPEERTLYDEMKKSMDVYLGGQADVRDRVEKKQMGEAKALLLGIQGQRLVDVSDKLEALIQFNEKYSDAKVIEMAALQKTTSAWIIGALVLAILAGLGFAFTIAARVSAPIVVMSKTMESAAEGDLTVRTDIHSTDEIGTMAVALNAFLEKLHDSISQVAQTSGQVAAASEELSSGAQQLASGSQEQASSLEETAASLEEMTGTIKQNAENAKQASSLATGSRDSADRGANVVGDAVSAMEGINEASKKIGEIIGVIDEIAFQTNLLALNAAVEAARAGDQGRGFAVVASEVRNLAQRSATAAKEIKVLIRDSLTRVDDGSKLVHASGETLREIVGSVKRVTDFVSEIAAAGAEQASGIEQVNRAVSQMDQVVQSNSAQTEELSATAEELSSQAEALRRLVDRFKIDSQSARSAVQAPVEKAAPAQKAPVRAAAKRPQRPARLRKNDSFAPPADAGEAPPPAAKGPSAHASGHAFEEF